MVSEEAAHAILGAVVRVVVHTHGAHALIVIVVIIADRTKNELFITRCTAASISEMSLLHALTHGKSSHDAQQPALLSCHCCMH